jgi:class 3 adenylate cyclase/tetratricopeptide (TPR) repeat protein
VAERRLVSVLFADLVGFTPLSESRDPEEVRDLLSRYFETCRRLIELYGGTVEKFIGDAVMAVWGTPTATEDDAERSVRAALDLVAAVSALGDEVGAPQLAARAGVMTGEAAVTVGAEGQGMVAGDLVNTASRVQSVAEPGTVLVAEATRRASERAIAYSDGGAHALKGKDEPIVLWRALRVVSGVGGRLRSEGLEAPFVGRDLELRQVKELFHACAEERRARLVSVIGIAGIGKSRLGWEFYKYFDGISGRVLWHRGRCLAYGEGVAYWALADMVRMRCRVAEDEPAASAREKLAAALVEHLLDPDERSFVEPRLAQLLGVGTSDVGDRAELFAAWRIFFERLAESDPVVLLFEDLQWADASLLDFVEHLLEWSRNHAIFVVTLARPELLERRPTWGAGQRQFTSITLEPLSDVAMRELLDGLVPGLPGRLQEQILARAEGVPLYAVETVRMLLDRGALVEDGAAYRVAAEVETLEVPETLHSLIAARLDGLSAEERQLLQEASVLGKTFTRDTLAAVASAGADIDPLLTAMVRKEVLGVQADPRSPEHGQYGFLQDLVRHVAYETLSRAQRKALHLAAADGLAGGFGEDEIAEVIAAHLVAAYETAPDAPDAADLKERARDALAGAGERARSLRASGEAVGYFKRAAELADDEAMRADLTFRAGEMAWSANDPVAARALLERAQATFLACDDSRKAARVSERLAMLDFHEGHAQQAITRLEAALETVDVGEPDADVAAIAAELGRFLALSPEHERAAPVVERALSLAAALDLPETLTGALNTKGVLLSAEGRLYEARLLYEGAVSLAVANDLPGSLSRAYNNLADLLEACDSFGESVEVCDRRLEHDRRRGDRTGEAIGLAAPISSLVLLGRWDEALARAAEVGEQATVVWTQSLLLPTVSILTERGDVDAARELLSRLSAVGESDDVQALASYGIVAAHVLRKEGRLQDALRTAEAAFRNVTEQFGPNSLLSKLALTEALEAATALGETPETIRLLATLDELPPGRLTPFLRAQRARFRGRSDEGDVGDEFGHAERLFGELGTPFYLAATQLEHAEWLAEQGQAGEAQPLLAQAREAFEQLGAKPWLERLSRAEAATPATVPG